MSALQKVQETGEYVQFSDVFKHHVWHHKIRKAAQTYSVFSTQLQTAHKCCTFHNSTKLFYQNQCRQLNQKKCDVHRKIFAGTPLLVHCWPVHYVLWTNCTRSNSATHQLPTGVVWAWPTPHQWTTGLQQPARTSHRRVYKWMSTTVRFHCWVLLT